MERKYTLICVSNNDSLLNSNLLRNIPPSTEVIIQHVDDSITIGYNSAIAKATGDILVFAHQDIFFPPDWWENLDKQISQLSSIDKEWGALGVFGISQRNGEYIGFVFSQGLNLILGQQFPMPVEASTLDEIVLILRKNSNLAFDPLLPGFHFYGSDICLEANRKGLKNYIISNFCIHNSQKYYFFPPAFWNAYRYMAKKWKNCLPIKTTCTTILRYGIPPLRQYLSSIFYPMFIRTIPNTRVPDPASIYDNLDISSN